MESTGSYWVDLYFLLEEKGFYVLLANAKDVKNVSVKKRNQQNGEEMPITHTPLRLYLPILAFFLIAWTATYYILVNFIDSTVPLLDAFTNALSFV